MPYTAQSWHDKPATDTALSAARLTVVEQGIVDANAAAAAALAAGVGAQAYADAKALTGVTATLTATATATVGKLHPLDASAAAFTVTLPSPAGIAGALMAFRQLDAAHQVTLSGLIDGATATVVVAGVAELISDGATWRTKVGDMSGVYETQADAALRVADFGVHLAQPYHVGGFAGLDYAGSTVVARPAGAGMVCWKNFPTKPVNMAPADIWLKPDAGGSIAVYLAEQTFEGYAGGTNLATTDNGSGTPLDVISLATGGGTATAQASTVGGSTRVGQFVTGTAGTTWAAFRAAVGMRTAVTVGCLWITPGSLPSANMQLLRTRRDSGGGTYVTAPTVRINPTTSKIEWMGSDGLAALTSVQSVSLAVPYYILEMELDCVNQHMRGWITPSTTGVSEAVGDTTSTVTVGAQVDEYAIGVLSNLASQSQRFDWLRVADINVRLNAPS